MNFRSCTYFLTVCKMGTINAAAKKLYISQQSLSQHILKLEKELGVPLFHRDTPLTLTAAGEIFRNSAQQIMDTLTDMDRQLAECRGAAAAELTIGMLDYGTPDFMPPLIEAFIKIERNLLLSTRELYAGDSLPIDIPLFISAKKLGEGFKSEVLFSDKLVVCVADSLLKSCYGSQWERHRSRLQQGDLSALKGCPFVRHFHTPLQAHSEMVFEQNHFTPTYLPVMGSPNTLIGLCRSGQAATITFYSLSQGESAAPPVYMLKNIPETVPAGYICYRKGAVLSGAAQRFLAVTRRYFKAIPRGSCKAL